MKSTNFLSLEEALTNLGTSGAVSIALFSLQNRHTQALTCGTLALRHRTAGIYSVQNRKAVYSYKANKIHVSLFVSGINIWFTSDPQPFPKPGFISSEVLAQRTDCQDQLQQCQQRQHSGQFTKAAMTL